MPVGSSGAVVSQAEENFLNACYKKMVSKPYLLHLSFLSWKIYKQSINQCDFEREDWGGNIRQTFFFFFRSNEICSQKGFGLNCLLTTFLVRSSCITRICKFRIPVA